jgi:multiple sugar transport system ATP-binding protein
MGRAIVREPQVFLMDEPLSNLDAKLRVQTRTQIASLQRRLGVTTVYVTHDQVEAMTMGDRVAVLKDGLLMQVDTPQNLYNRPANVFVAGFIGSPAMNLLQLTVSADGAHIGPRRIPLTPKSLAAATSTNAKVATIGIRPEDIEITPDTDAWPVEVDLVESLGADAYVYGHVTMIDGSSKDVIVRADGRTPPSRGETVHVRAKPDHVHVFDSDTGQRLGD